MNASAPTAAHDDTAFTTGLDDLPILDLLALVEARKDATEFELVLA